MLASSEDGRRNALKFSLASDIVELVVLTADDAFLQTLRDAVGRSRRLWHVPSADKVSDLLLAGQVGILVLDVQALHETATVFVTQIKRQFPDLVVVVAGNRDAETLLVGLISGGLVYRFIHKPMSPARAKLFADAAVRRYDEQRRVSVPAKPANGLGKQRLVIAGCGVLATVAALGILLHLTHQERAASPREIANTPTAETPLRSPSDTVARSDLTEVRERLLARAENALLEERLDEAEAAIEIARKAGVESGRIAFLTSQLARSRSLVKTSATLAAPKSSASNTPAEGGLTESLSLAAERTQEGRLLDPEKDSALYYVQKALRMAPNSAAAADAESSLALALVTATHSAIDRGDFTRAASLLDAARGIASPTNVANLEQKLRAARQQGQSEGAAVDSSANAAGVTRDPKSASDQPH